jgi:hypothetical protein
MEYALEERIGNPDLFTGRNEEMTYFLKWINDIKERKSQSTAILARRKMGKTAIMERLEIEHLDIKDISKEYAKSLEKMKLQYRRLQGKYHSQKTNRIL